MLLSIYAWLTGGKVVYLQSLTKEVFKSIAHKTPYGMVVLKYGCILKEDGSIENKTFISWKQA